MRQIIYPDGGEGRQGGAATEQQMEEGKEMHKIIIKILKNKERGGKREEKDI